MVRLCLLGAAVASGAGGLRAQEVVYVLPSDLNALLAWGAYPPTPGTAIGDDAHLGGSNRLLQQLSVAVASDRARTATMELALYGLGSNGLPSGLLWSESRELNIAQPASNAELVRNVLFNPVGVVVPTDLVWAVTFSNITSYDPAVPDLSRFGLLWNEADNLAAGSAAGAANDTSRAFRKVPGFGWQETTGPMWGSVMNDAVLTIGITAAPIPEPGLAALLLLGAAAGAGRRRR